MLDRETIVDLIYEAPVVPEFWPNVLDAVASTIGCVGGELLTSDLSRIFKWTASEATRPMMTSFVAGGWGAKNERLNRTVAVKHAGFVTDLDIFSPEEIEREPSYFNIFRPYGFGWGTGTAITMPSGDFAAYSFERLAKHGPIPKEDIDALDSIRPHLARAALLATKLQMERARAIGDALAAIGLPAAVLAYGGRVLHANELIQRMSGQVTFLAYDRLAFNSPAPQSLFINAVGNLHKNEDAAIKSIPVRATEELPPCVVHLLPIKGTAQDIFLRAHMLLLITPLASSDVLDVDILSGLFDLSPAEARLARELTRGRTTREISGRCNLSLETLKSQLKAIFAKTGAHRQSELVSLLTFSVPKPVR